MRDDIVNAIVNLLNGYVARYSVLPFDAANAWLFYDVFTDSYVQYPIKATRDLNTDLLSAKSLPHVSVSDSKSSEVINYKTGGLADVYLTLDLTLFVNKSTSQSAALNLLDLATKQAIASNPTLSNLVAHVTILPQTGGVSDSSDNVAYRTRQIRIFYEASSTNGL